MLPGFLPSGNGSMSPHSGIWASTQEGSIGGQCLAAEAASGHTNTAYGSIITPSWASLLHQESMGLDELMFSELSVVLLHFSVHLFFFLKRDFKRGSCISAIFELSWWSLTLFFFFYGLLSSYRSFFIWTYRAKAICSVTPFKVSAKPPGMDLDHVFVCDVTVGCSGNDYNVSQRKHLVFMRWADSRNILVLQNKTQRFFFVQMFSIITTNQGKEKMKKMAFKLYFCFLSMQVLNYMIL